jgi:hypothetical protein
MMISGFGISSIGLCSRLGSTNTLELLLGRAEKMPGIAPTSQQV